MNKTGQAELRSFGVGLAMVLWFFAWLRWRQGGPACAWLSAGALSAALALWLPRAFAPIYGPWMAVVGVLGRVNLYLLSAVLYYGVLTPYGALSRLLGRDPLDLRPRTGDSYWVKREPSADPARYDREF